MKKIAILCSTDYNDYPTGGMMSFIKDAAPYLAQRFDVHFWGVDAGGNRRSFTSGGHEFPVRFFGKVKTGKKLVPNMLRVVWDLYRNRNVIRRERYDAIYIHGVPLNLAIHEGLARKRINHVHGLTNPFLMQGLRGLSRWFLASAYSKYRRKVVEESDLVLLAADNVGIQAFKAQHASAQRIVKIENFCDVDLFSPDVPAVDAAAYGIKATDSLIVHVGRVAHQKDPLLAIRVLHAVRTAPSHASIKLAMIGDGPLLSEAKKLAEDLGVADSVLFLGNLPRSEIARWLTTADIYLYTSHANGYPISLAEAAQAGLPIVSTDVTGVHDLVVPGVNGELVATREPLDFLPAITKALASRERYSPQSLLLASRYAPDVVLNRLCREISDVTA